MEKHLILIDLDGTLLNNSGKISDFNKEVLAKLQTLGHEVIIVTGRAHYRSHMFYEELTLNTVFVNRNGSFIHRPNDQAFKEYIQYIPRKTMSEIVNGIDNEYIDSLFYENKNTIYVGKGNKDFYNYELCKVSKFEELEDVNLITMFIVQEKTEEVKAFLNSIEGLYLEIYYASNEYKTALFQIYPNCNKANSIKFLSDYYKVPLKNILAFGDGINDVQMIKEAGIGIAMANAIDEVKNVAKVILEETNDESGVGKYLIKYFNI